MSAYGADTPDQNVAQQVVSTYVEKRISTGEAATWWDPAPIRRWRDDYADRVRAALADLTARQPTPEIRVG